MTGANTGLGPVTAQAFDTATAQRLWADSENDTHVTYGLKQDTAQ